MSEAAALPTADSVAVVSAEAFRYRLPLRAPLVLTRGTITEREGVLVRVVDAAGRTGWGEAAPLPGFSPESLADVLAELPPVLRRLRGARVTADGLETPRTRRARGRAEMPVPPSLVVAARQAEADLASQAAGVSLADWLAARLGTVAARTVEVQALVLGGKAADVAAAVEAAVAAGARTVKLKVGRGALAADLARVRAAARALPPGGRLRLDANRAWSFSDAVAFAEGIAPLGATVEYVEEPLAGAARLFEFARATGLPVALDESLVGIRPADVRRAGFARAAVLKPTLGQDAAFWAEFAGQVRGEVPLGVASSAWESGVGARHTVALAAALGGGAHGLAPYRDLAADVLVEPLPVGSADVVVADVLARTEVDVARLERLNA